VALVQLAQQVTQERFQSEIQVLVLKDYNVDFLVKPVLELIRIVYHALMVTIQLPLYQQQEVLVLGVINHARHVQRV